MKRSGWDCVNRGVSPEVDIIDDEKVNKNNSC